MRRAIGRFGDCRLAPHSAARSSQYACPRRGRGAGVGPTAHRPRGSTVMGKRSRQRVPREDSESSPARSPLAHPPNVPNFGKSQKRQLRAEEAARNWEIRQYGRRAYGSQNVTS
jgi:hypothetical protein